SSTRSRPFPPPTCCSAVTSACAATARTRRHDVRPPRCEVLGDRRPAVRGRHLVRAVGQRAGCDGLCRVVGGLPFGGRQLHAGAAGGEPPRRRGRSRSRRRAGRPPPQLAPVGGPDTPGAPPWAPPCPFPLFPTRRSASH